MKSERETVQLSSVTTSPAQAHTCSSKEREMSEEEDPDVEFQSQLHEERHTKRSARVFC